MTKVEKSSLSVIIVLIVALVFLAGHMSKQLKPLEAQVNERGLKSVVDQLWNGSAEQGEESQSHRTTQAAQNAEDSTSGDPAERPVP